MRSATLCPLLVLVIASLGLANCVADEPTVTLQRFPTITPSPLFGGTLPTPLPATMIPTQVEPTITPPPGPLPAVLALPDARGVSVACAANTLRLPLMSASGSQIGVVERLLPVGDGLYVLADGGLYRIDQAGVQQGQAVMQPLILPGNNLAGRPVQELVDIDLDPSSNTLLLLDKAEHIFRFDPSVGTLGLAYRASPDRDEVDGAPPFQFTAVTVDGSGRLVVLDSSRGIIWAVNDQVTLSKINENDALASATDIAAVGDQFYTLQQAGSLRVTDGDKGTLLWRDSDPRPLGLSLRTSTHLGIPLILAIDAVRREVVTYIPGGQIVSRHVFAFPGLGLLRDAAFAAQHLYAIAGADLLVYPSPEGGSPAACLEYGPGMFSPPTLFGTDVVGALAGGRLPLDQARLPDLTHLYPGASRLYRLGVHHGTDFYGFDKGTPVYAAAPGIVTEADLNYQEMSYEEFLLLTREADQLGMTPLGSLNRLEGRRVVIDHGRGVKTAYAHLDSIAPGIIPGVHVDEGTILGGVGVSGTSGEGRPGTESPHLHFEIWIGDRYLGQGLSIRETMWWLAQIFAQ